MSKIDEIIANELDHRVSELERRNKMLSAQLVLSLQAVELSIKALEKVEFIPASESAICPWCHAAAYIRKNIRHSDTCLHEIAFNACREVLTRIDVTHE